MKKIIDGKLYNTETATEICNDEFSNWGDFHHWKDTLYQTKKGAFFMHGEGGPLSKYAENVGNGNRSGSKCIWVVEEEEAKSFCIDCDVEKALELFPDDIQKG